MGLPSSGTISASDINIEAARVGTTNAPLGIQTGTAGAGSLVKLYDDATPSPVDQNSPYAYSDFYGKSYTPPVISCGTSTAAIGQGSGNGYFEAQLDFSTTTGAIVIYFYVSSVPDGISFLYNSVTYNTLTSNTDGRITATAGTNNIVGKTGYEASLIAGSPYTLTKSLWNGTSFGATGNTQSGLVAAASNINLSSAGIVYTLVIPKTSASPSNGVLKIMATIAGTAWRVNAPCPITLPSFTTNSVNSTSQGACCATQNQTYYFARNANLSTNFIIDTNTLPQVNNFVFSNSTGATALADGYYKISSTQAIYVVNGVVDSITTCTACPSAFTSSGTSVTAVSGCQDTIDRTLYHDGSGTWPVNGDRCFSDPGGTIPLATGYYKTGEFTSTSLGGIYITSIGGNLGYMYSTFSCLQSYSSSVNSTSSNVCSATINQTYYHNGGIAASITVGDTVYTSNTGVTKLSTGYYRTLSNEYIVVNSSGVVSSISSCTSVIGPISASGRESSSQFVCFNSGTTQYWYEGTAGTLPGLGDKCYDTSSVPGTVLVAGWYRKDTNTSDGRMQIDSTGVIITDEAC